MNSRLKKILANFPVVDQKVKDLETVWHAPAKVHVKRLDQDLLHLLGFIQVLDTGIQHERTYWTIRPQGIVLIPPIHYGPNNPRPTIDAMTVGTALDLIQPPIPFVFCIDAGQGRTPWLDITIYLPKRGASIADLIRQYRTYQTRLRNLSLPGTW